MSDRISMDHYAMLLAVAASTRSEDPHTKVGACALDRDNRVIGLAYNGLPQGICWTTDQWSDRDHKRLFMQHAEQNLCSLFKKGECETVAVTVAPCCACANLLSAHGVKRVIYRDLYQHDVSGMTVLDHHKIDAIRVKKEEMGVHLVGSEVLTGLLASWVNVL